MERLNITDIYKLDKGDNVLFLFGKYHKDKLGEHYEPPLDVCIDIIDKISPKLGEMGVDHIFAFNIFSNVTDFTVENLTQMRDFLNDEIGRRSNE